MHMVTTSLSLTSFELSLALIWKLCLVTVQTNAEFVQSVGVDSSWMRHLTGVKRESSHKSGMMGSASKGFSSHLIHQSII